MVDVAAVVLLAVGADVAGVVVSVGFAVDEAGAAPKSDGVDPAGLAEALAGAEAPNPPNNDGAAEAGLAAASAGLGAGAPAVSAGLSLEAV